MFMSCLFNSAAPKPHAHELLVLNIFNFRVCFLYPTTHVKQIFVLCPEYAIFYQKNPNELR